MKNDRSCLLGAGPAAQIRALEESNLNVECIHAGVWTLYIHRHRIISKVSGRNQDASPELNSHVDGFSVTSWHR